MSTIQRAQGRWREILTRVGIEPAFLRNVHGPCPLCGGKDRFRFDDKQGQGSYYCEGCGPGYGIQLVMKWLGVDMPAASREIDKIIGTGPAEPPKPEPKKSPRPRLVQVGRRMQRVVEDDPVSRYLAKRGLNPALCTRTILKQPYYEDRRLVGYYPCMAHLVADQEGNPATIHLTYLDGAGGKADVPSPKKVLPPSRGWMGGGIRLFDYTDTLGIAEGIETAMAARELFDVPCWSLVSANSLGQFKLPWDVKRLVIFGDNDASFTGQAFAYGLAHRLLKERQREGRPIDIDVKIPDDAGVDWADVHEERTFT